MEGRQIRGATKGEKAYITEYMILGEKSEWVKTFILKTVRLDAFQSIQKQPKAK